MSDYLKRGFRAQLTLAMDSVLRTAVFEITKIFENSLHDHQVELAQKVEEISRLQTKLETAERKLRETESRGTGEEGQDETQKESEDVLSTPGETSIVPEIDVEVPDDWCAPLGCDNIGWTKQDDGVCPSVTLRPLSISLWHLPNIKQEVEDEGFESNQLTTVRHRSKKRSSSDKRLKHIQNQSLSLRGPKRRGPGRPSRRSNTENLLKAIKQEYSDPPATMGSRQRRRDSQGTERGNAVKSQASGRKISATEPGSDNERKHAVVNHSDKTYTCKFCHKVFDTEFGRSVHIRSHKRCPACRKVFTFPSYLSAHKKTCRKLKKLNAKKAQSVDLIKQKPETNDEHKPALPSKKQPLENKSGTPTSDSNSPTSLLKGASKSKTHHCPVCKKKCYSRFTLRDHLRVHTGEKPFACTVCSRKFRIKHSLKVHMFKAHKELSKYEEANGELAWTRPLDGSEDNEVDSSLSSNNLSPADEHQDDKLTISQDKKQFMTWQSMGKQSSEGFICSECGKVLKSKYLLMEHFRIHTGEKPIRCEKCGAMFRCRSQMSTHRSKCQGTLKITCQKCGKTFSTQTLHKQHVVNFHKDWPYVCQLCGKGFFTAGRLSNHYERAHV